jgi:hypothetical protein
MSHIARRPAEVRIAPPEPAAPDGVGRLPMKAPPEVEPLFEISS